MSKAHQVIKRPQGAMVAGRRARVAEGLCRGLTRYQIYEEMAAEGEYINPRTGEPWVYSTIQTDARAVHKQWLKETTLHYDIHVSRLLGQIRAVRKSAWETQKLDTVIKTIEQETKLLGLDKATKVDLDWKEEMRKVGVDPSETFDDLVQSTYEKLVLAGETGE